MNGFFMDDFRLHTDISITFDILNGRVNTCPIIHPITCKRYQERRTRKAEFVTSRNIQQK